jgi:hypothetical protein
MKLTAATGVARLARFRADGLAAFDASAPGLLNALAPWIAFAIVGFVLAAAKGPARDAVGALLASAVALLAPPVIAQVLARWFGRAGQWLRYAVAITWCQWIMPPLLLLAMIASALLSVLSLSQGVSEVLVAVAVLGYAVALQVFVAHAALAITVLRAVVFSVAVQAGTLALILGPLLLGEAWRSGA